MSVNWAMGMPQVDPGQSFMNAFEQGRAKRREADSKRAMNALLLNPDDPQALTAYGEHDPKGALEFRGQQQARIQQQLEQHRENIVRGAQLIRELQPKDQASWDQARAMAGQAGIDLSQVPAQFDPQYVQGITKIAEAFAPQKAQGQPTSYEEYQRAQADPEYGKFLEERRGPIVANNGDGTFTLIPRAQAQQQGGPQPGQVEEGYRFKGGDPADPNSWEPVGGQTPQASGNFPGN